jgi:hypothetical protein
MKLRSSLTFPDGTVQTTAAVAGTAAKRARVNRTAALSIANNAWTRIVFDTSETDNDTMFDAVNGRLVCKTAGLFVLSAALIWNGASGGSHRIIAIGAGASGAVHPVVENGSAPPGTAVQLRANCACTVTLAVNDFIEVWCLQDSGAAQALTLSDAGPGGTTAQSVWLAAARIGS